MQLPLDRDCIFMGVYIYFSKDLGVVISVVQHFNSRALLIYEKFKVNSWHL